MSRLAVLTLFGLSLTPAHALTAKEAATMNMRLAIELCIDNYRTPQNTHAAFNEAGFLYDPEFMGGPEDVIHWFHTPANGVFAIVQPAEGQSYCAINTTLMGVTEAVQVTGAALQELYPNQFSYGAVEGAPINATSPNARIGECSGYVAFLPRRMVVITVGNAGQDPVCVEDGSAQVMIQM